jgi:site-specific DNA-cytosine methylase
MEQVIVTKDNMGLFDIRPLIRLFSTMKAGQYMVEVKRHRNQRTNEQNKWLWGCIYPMMLSGFIDIGWDDFTDIDKIQAAGISNSQQYKLAGNSIVVSCLYHIFRKLFVDTQQENEQLKLF